MNKDEILYREIRSEDDPFIATIIRKNLEAYDLNIPGTAYFDDNLNHLSVYYLENSNTCYYCIAEYASQLIGGVGLDSFPYFEDCAELQKLYLCDEAKGYHIGMRLIEEIEKKAVSLGYRRMYLETHSCLVEAIHLYEKCGYRLIEKPEQVVHSTMDHFYLKDLPV